MAMADTGSTSGLTSEAAALANIVDWSASCPGWQRDALRRLYNSDALTTRDLDELLTICKGEAEGQFLTADDVRDPSAGGAAVTLGQLHGVENVNALAVGERLTFGKAGVTVIYGDNGAGKSGYARILKSLCRARSPKGDTILPNIYALAPGVPTASIDFYIGGQKHSATWSQGQAADPQLTAISVFDSRTANVHVDSTNDLAYTPLPLKILASLAQACQDLKTSLAVEIKALENQTPAILSDPDCKPSTAVGKLIVGLSAKTAPADVTKLAGLTAAEEGRLQTLLSDLGPDPSRIARTLENSRKGLAEIQSGLADLARAADTEQALELQSAAKASRNAQAAATLAMTDLFASEPLPEVGSEVWRSLWTSARAYSDKVAYPHHHFPYVDDGARCVLCQQKLEPEAVARLGRFEAFVQNESSRLEREALEHLDALRSALAPATMSMRTVRMWVTAIRDELGDAALALMVRRAAVSAAWRIRAMLASNAADIASLPLLVAAPTQGLETLQEALSSRLSVLAAESDSPARRALATERDELTDRKWLAVVKDDVLAAIDRCKAIAALQKASKDTATNRITAQSADFARALVTNRLRARFAMEIDKLGVAGLAVELQQARTSAGIPFFQVRLMNKPAEPVGKILSEGEHRCVALAAFMAELATVDTASAIVFDDPVSSLDHRHRDRVAGRLAEEGQARQVIVFTHDMAFLLLLDEACRPTKDRPATQIQYRLVSRGRDETGFCHAEPPASVMPLDRVIDGMRTHLANVQGHHARGDQAAWHREVVSFQDQLRTAWERAVEDIVGPVVRRLSRKVDTGGLIKLSVVTEADCVAMREAFGRCSMLLHSQPGEINPALPTPAAVDAEITALADWVAGLRARQAKAA
jgi:ABC-type transport system involved in cytochrome c biogenesis ATPase subunit